MVEATRSRAKTRQGELEHFPIIVIGAGPTGLTLANLLGTYGARALVVERNASTVSEPRAVSIDDESLRTMQAAGLIDVVLPTVVPGYGSEYRTPAGRCFLKVNPTGRPYGYPRRNAFRQPRLEAQLRAGLDRFDLVETRFDTTLVDFVQDADGVVVTLQPKGGEPVKLCCDYLVGADGAGSLVRTGLGLKLEGETFSEKWLIIDLEQSPSVSRETQVYCDVRRPCIALPGPDQTRRYEFKLLPGETPEQVLESAVIGRLLAEYGADPCSVIKRKTVYTFHARLAPQWSKGRVFLAGDACHLTPPFAGQGMNSGIRDAHNLAWKLAWVASGRAPVSLLGSYETERREHVGAMIQLALRMGRIMGPKTPLHGLLTQAAFIALSVWPAARDYFAEMKYKPKPRFDVGFVVESDQPDIVTLVGRLLPQPTVVDQRGQGSLLDAWLGDGFALVGIDVDAQQLAAVGKLPTLQALAPSIMRLSTKPNDGAPSGLADLRVKPGDFDGAQSGRILLVRPDRYVAGAFLPSRAKAFAVRLDALLGPVASAQAASQAPAL
ncbi:bifunctional 3-(3-hydroxy-phenyl)propionate/3-hydroxycinnamic acid hydroxylase [soil metagenome]